MVMAQSCGGIHHLSRLLVLCAGVGLVILVDTWLDRSVFASHSAFELLQLRFASKQLLPLLVNLTLHLDLNLTQLLLFTAQLLLLETDRLRGERLWVKAVALSGDARCLATLLESFSVR